MVKWLGTALIILGLIMANLELIPVSFAVAGLGSVLWAIESVKEPSLLLLNIVMTILNFSAYIINV